MKIEVETLDELRVILRDLAPGLRAGMHYDVYALFFPPGEPDDNARARAARLAAEYDCALDNQPDEHTIWFIKHDPSNPAAA
jgi:hypothetical protein